MPTADNRYAQGSGLSLHDERRDLHRHGPDRLVTLHLGQQKTTSSKPQHPRGRQCSLIDLPLPLYPSLDSMSMYLPLDAVFIDENFSWNRRFHAKSGAVTLEYPKNDLPLGVNFLRVEQAGVRVAISSKILAHRYRELTNWSTIDDALKNLDSISGITFDRFRVLDCAQVTSVDATRDVVVSGYPADYLHALSLATTKPGFVCEKYYDHNSRELQSVVFTRRLSKRRDRLSIYWKYPELQTGKNRELRDYFNPNTMWPVIRFEVSIRDFASIRRAFDVQSPQKLFDILTSQCNPIASLFAEVTPTLPRAVDYGANWKLIDIEKREGRRAITAALDWDVNRTKHFVYTHAPKSNRARTLRPYLQLIDEHQAQERAALHLEEELEELRDKLSAPFCAAEGLRPYGGES